MISVCGDERRRPITLQVRTRVNLIMGKKTAVVPCDRKRVQPGTLVHVPGEVGHVMKTILC